MAWTKAKTAVVVGVVAILAVTSTTVIGFKLAQKHRPTAKPAMGLFPVMLNATANIQPDGTILFQGTVEETNNASWTTGADSITEAAGFLELLMNQASP